LRAYYLFPVQWSWDFPFVAAGTPGWSNPDYAGGEEIAGLAVTFPFLGLVLLLPLAFWRRSGEERAALGAMAGAIGGHYLGVGGFLLTFFSSTERAMAEFGPTLALLALVGWLGLERWAQEGRGRRWVWRATMPLGLAVVPMGVLVSFNYHGNTFSRDNPARWRRLEQASYDAISRAGLAIGTYEGPRILKVRFVPRPVGTVETLWRAADARADERLAVEHLAEREVRFGFARGAEPVRWGRPLTWKLGHTHTVEVQMPSLYAAPSGGGFRRLEEFRERSSVTVWFSGGRALGFLVPPLPAGLAPGGAVGANFSGEVRSVTKRVFRRDELLQAADPPWPRGGTLRLRVVLPVPLAPEGEPLLATGVLYASDLVVVRATAAGEVTVNFERHGAAPIASRPLHLAPMQEHILEITLPSCAAAAFGVGGKGDVVVRVDGQEVLRTRSDTHGFGAGSEAIGRNPFGPAPVREFRGWILDARWEAGTTHSP
jgi:hypothetical protein